jgi:hypothetical protein
MENNTIGLYVHALAIVGSTAFGLGQDLTGSDDPKGPADQNRAI